MSAVAPNEITEEILKARLRTALARVFDPAGTADPRDIEQEVERVYADGSFHEFVNVVDKATTAERLRCSQICVRHGKGQIAAQIREGR